MMEIDRISYIFGSFARRRQSQEVNSAKRRSIEPSKISHDRSKSAPHTSKRTDSTSSRAKSVCNFAFDENKYRCTMCQNQFVEPRVLPCLHTFCTRCLQQLETNDVSMWQNGSDVSLNDKTDSSGSANNSGGSGYVSDRRETSEECWTPTGLSCPRCGAHCELPTAGVLALPSNYLIQHRIILATLNARSTKLLCDVCTTDILATTRCTECALSLCEECADNHRRQRITSHHEVLDLDEARRKGITRVRRQVMCSSHPEQELSTFCASCCQVICRECITTLHRGHIQEPVSRAVKSYTSNIIQALGKTRSIAEKSAITATRLQTTTKRIEAHCNHIQNEIEKFIQSYIQAVEQHRNNLQQEVSQAKIEKLHTIEQHTANLQKKIHEAKDVVEFADELLNEGTEVEILSFVKPILKRLELCNKIAVPELKVSESLQFLPEECVQNADGCCPLYGIITTQTVAPAHSILHTEGLQNIRVGRKTETILETRDRNDTPLQRGGDTIGAELKYRDTAVSKTLPVHIEDRRDGTYRLNFVPDVSGKYVMSVTVNGQTIKDNPFPITVRPFRPHHGMFHCCSFCSSGGSKEAVCGCGGKMPGGYKGCGHGHEGHPGRRHWSCCGNIMEHSECGRRNSTHYQFTL